MIIDDLLYFIELNNLTHLVVEVNVLPENNHSNIGSCSLCQTLKPLTSLHSSRLYHPDSTFSRHTICSACLRQLKEADLVSVVNEY